MLFVAVFASGEISCNALLITSGLFAIAGAISTVAVNMRKKDETDDEDIKDEWDMFKSDD
jgi:hypothetical protein